MAFRWHDKSGSYKTSGQSVISGLYAITPDELDTTVLLHKTRLALRGGVRVLQYRNKAADVVVGLQQETLRLEQAWALRDLTHEFSVPLIINDDAALAQQVDADGVHLGGADGSITEARARLGDDKLIGVSCYNRLALAHQAVRQGADYVAFGSFFSSTVKPDAPQATLELLMQARREIALPLVAIGGINLHNGLPLVQAGADALAVISALFDATDITTTAQNFSKLFIQERAT